MAVLRLFASAREAAGTNRDTLPGGTVGEVLDAARARYGDRFSALLESCRVWVNGESATGRHGGRRDRRGRRPSSGLGRRGLSVGLGEDGRVVAPAQARAARP